MKKGFVQKELKVPRHVKSQQVKDTIYAAAVELIRTHGYDYVTVNNVCAAAGVSTGSFYHHFKNKDELLAYYFIAGSEKYRQELGQELGQERGQTLEPGGGPDIIRALLAIYRLHIRFCEEQGPAFIKSFYTPLNTSLSATNSRKSGSSVTLPSITMSVRELSAAKERGHIREYVDPERLAVQMCVVVKGCIFEWCVSECAFPLWDLCATMLIVYLQSAVTPEYHAEFPGPVLV